MSAVRLSKHGQRAYNSSLRTDRPGLTLEAPTEETYLDA